MGRMRPQDHNPEVAVRWHLLHTKPKQEKFALRNLEEQGYQCYLPTLPSEKLRQGALTISDIPLFPRYMFIRLGDGDACKGAGPVRSTKGVSRLVSFGNQPAIVEDELIDILHTRESATQSEPERLFKPGEKVRLTEGAFAGIEGIYQMADGERRVMVLIRLLSKPVSIQVPASSLRKTG